MDQPGSVPQQWYGPEAEPSSPVPAYTDFAQPQEAFYPTDEGQDQWYPPQAPRPNYDYYYGGCDGTQDGCDCDGSCNYGRLLFPLVQTHFLTVRY